MKIARVEFDNYNLQQYDYYTDLDIEIGDLVVVESPKTGLTIVTVKNVIESETVKAAKWVVCKIDLTDHNKRLKKEKERQELLAILAKKAKRVEELDKYKFLAAIDPEAAEMIERLKDLSK